MVHEKDETKKNYLVQNIDLQKEYFAFYEKGLAIQAFFALYCDIIRKHSKTNSKILWKKVFGEKSLCRPTKQTSKTINLNE